MIVSQARRCAAYCAVPGGPHNVLRRDSRIAAVRMHRSLTTQILGACGDDKSVYAASVA